MQRKQLKHKKSKTSILGANLIIFTIARLFAWLTKPSSSNKPNNNEGSNKVYGTELYCKYDSSYSVESSQGALRIYIPTNDAYINYNIVHTINEDRNVDTWRMSQAFAYNDELKNPTPLTTINAEWEMALKIQGRDDFIGGWAHGDEKITSLKVFINKKEININGITNLTPFDELRIVINSIGYDPNNHTTEALRHYKEFIINEGGITLNQKVEWLNDYNVLDGYLAMMPPLKTYTDHFYTDANKTPKEIDFSLYHNVKSATLYGVDSPYTYTMSFEVDKTLNGNNIFQIHDNGGGTYNKMYFYVCNGQSVVKGDVWNTTTYYQIAKK